MARRSAIDHLITTSYNNLKGLSTDSDYSRPPQYCSRGTVNMMRDPDGNFTPRRGFQAMLGAVGGLGISTAVLDNGNLLATAVNKDGNLYQIGSGFFEITYTGPTWLEFSIFVNQDFDPFSLGWSFLPWGLAPWGAPTNPGVFGNATLKRAAVANGAQAGVNTFNVINPHVLVIGNTIQFIDQNNELQQRVITNTTVNSITFGGLPASIFDGTGIDFYNIVDFGIGYDAPGFYTVDQFINVLLGIPDVNVNVPATITTPAAFLFLTEPTNIINNGAPLRVAFYFWKQIDQTVAVVFPGLLASTTSINFENATFANFFGGRVFISTGSDPVMKYDGKTVYKAGLPQGNYPTLTEVNMGGGNIANGDYQYLITFDQKDALGNELEGSASQINTITVASGPSEVDVTVNNILAGSGYNTDCAIANGAQGLVNTINVDAGHTLKIGDQAFFIEQSSAIANGTQVGVRTITVLPALTTVAGDVITFIDSNTLRQLRTVLSVTVNSITIVDTDPLVFIDDTTVISVTRDRLITNITATSITINGNPVNIIDDQVISNGLKINIYRTIAGGTAFFLVRTIPNNSLAPTTTYADNYADGTFTNGILNGGLQAGGEYADPDRPPDAPPVCKYVFARRNQMIYAGAGQSGDDVYFSEGDNPEAVPAATNFFSVPPNDDDVSGIGEAGSSLIIFKDKSIYGVTGDLLNSQFSVNPIAPGTSIGCAANATVKSINGMLYFLSSDGVYALIENTIYPVDKDGTPIPISRPIDVIFRTISANIEQQFRFKQATALNHTRDHQYWLFMPCVNPITTPILANNFSRTFVYDYQSKDWFEWDTINAAGGFISFEDTVFLPNGGLRNAGFVLWQERRLSNILGPTSNTYRQLSNYRLIDQVDHVYPINVNWLSSWEDVGQPQIRKKYIHALLLIDRISNLRQFNNPQLNFSTYLDRLAGLKHTQALVTTVDNSSLWSQSGWGVTPWSGYSDAFIRVNLRQGTVTKAMQIGFQMREYNASFKLQGFQLEISPDFRTIVAR